MLDSEHLVVAGVDVGEELAVGLFLEKDLDLFFAGSGVMLEPILDFVDGPVFHRFGEVNLTLSFEYLTYFSHYLVILFVFTFGLDSELRFGVKVFTPVACISIPAMIV